MNTIVLHLSFIYLLIIHQKLNNSAANSVVDHRLNLVIGTWAICNWLYYKLGS